MIAKDAHRCMLCIYICIRESYCHAGTDHGDGSERQGVVAEHHGAEHHIVGAARNGYAYLILV